MSEKCPIIAIDPGNRQSAYCVIDCNTLRPLEFGKVDKSCVKITATNGTIGALALGDATNCPVKESI